MMLERALRLKEAILAVGREQDPTIPDVDWDIAKELCDFLRPFHSLTENVSGSRYSTISLPKAMIEPLKTHLKRQYCCPEVCQAAVSFGEKFNEYADQFEQDSIIVAALLDPRIKTSFMDNMHLFATTLLRKYIDEDLDSSLESSSSSRVDLIDQAFINNYTKDECHVYLELPRETKDCDPILYWRNNESKFPKLSQLAKIVLPIQASSTPCERTNSRAGLVYTPLRNRLLSDSLRSNVLLQSWLNYLEID